MKKIAVGFVIFIVTLICIPLSFQVIYQAQSPETDFNPPQSLAITKEQNEQNKTKYCLNLFGLKRKKEEGIYEKENDGTGT